MGALVTVEKKKKFSIGKVLEVDAVTKSFLK
jgi:hypothetical protein